MTPHNMTYKGLMTTVNTGYAGSGSSSTWKDKYKTSFSFTGFGRNDPKNKLKPTPGSYVREDHFFSEGSCIKRYRGTYPPYTIVGTMIESGSLGTASLYTRNPKFTLGYDTTTYNECLSKFYDELRDSNLNIAVDLAEGGETYRMIKNAVVAANTVVNSARRLKRRLKHEPSKVAAEAWLTWKYGVSPTLQTIYEALQYTARRFDEIKVDAKRTRTQPVRETLKDGGPYYVSHRLEYQYQYRCRIGAYVVPSNLDAFNLGRISSLNPAVIAWELVPLSFVFDWFWDVGSYLQNMEASLTSSVKLHDVYVTEVAVLQGYEYASSEEELQWISTYQFTAQYSYRCNYRKVIKRRYIPTGFPEPRLPAFTGKLGAQRILSAAALLRTIVLGKV